MEPTDSLHWVIASLRSVQPPRQSCPENTEPQLAKDQRTSAEFQHTQPWPRMQIFLLFFSSSKCWRLLFWSENWKTNDYSNYYFDAALPFFSAWSASFFRQFLESHAVGGLAVGWSRWSPTKRATKEAVGITAENNLQFLDPADADCQNKLY